jgi:hypothetical protein
MRGGIKQCDWPLAIVVVLSRSRSRIVRLHGPRGPVRLHPRIDPSEIYLAFGPRVFLEGSARVEISRS